MTKDEELDQLRAEKAVWREALQRKDEEAHQLQQEKQILREGLKQAIQAIEHLQGHVKTLEGLIECLQERINNLERQQAKDSHNTSFPPPLDRFVPPPNSLPQKSGNMPGAQKGPRGHSLRQLETP